MIIIITTLTAFFCVTVTTEELDPFSDSFINLINAEQNSWIAGRNFPAGTPVEYIKQLCGVLSYDGIDLLDTVVYDDDLIATLPEQYDPRDKWPNCPSLKQISDQGSCGSCWAVAAVDAMTDRYCIQSNGTKQFRFSAEDLISCCTDCGSGCEGGIPYAAWEFWKSTGIVSGGSYNSSEGCRPYTIEPCMHGIYDKLEPCKGLKPTPKCLNTCEQGYNTKYANDKHRGKSSYSVKNDESQIRAEIYQKGSVEVGFVVYEDFRAYKSGVYRHVKGSPVGKHAVRVIGWGVENGQQYWLAANSWNTSWGDKGYFKILRGKNECDIENQVVGGDPNYS